MTDNNEWFAAKVLQMRDDLRTRLGGDYLQTIQPFMTRLREDARAMNISVMKAFQHAVEPHVTGGDPNPLLLWCFGAALAELYLLRQKLLPSVGRDA